MSELYELPNGWKWEKFIDIIDNYDSKRRPIKASERETMKGDFPYYGSTGIIDYVNDYLYDGEYLLISEDGANLVMRTYPIAFIAKGKFWVNNHSHIVKAKKEYTSNKFLEFYFSILDLNPYITGSAQPKLSQQKLNIIPIPLPHLSEQQRIVSKLDLLFAKIDKSIELHQKNMAEADAFMGSVLNEVFGELEEKYPKIIFDKVCNKITDGSHNPPKGVDSSEYLMLSSKNIFNNSINFDNPRYLSKEDFELENKRTDVSLGDVLLTIVGTIGRTAVINFEEKFTLQRSVAVLKPKKELLNSYFLMYSLQKNLEILMDGAKGAAQKGIYLKSVKNLEIVNTPIHVQQKVVDYLDSVSEKMEKVKSIQKEKMNSLKALKASILDKAFRGEL